MGWLACVALLYSRLVFAGTTQGWPELSSKPTGIDEEAGRHDAALIVAIEDYAFLPDIPGASRNAADWEAWLLHRGVPAPNIHLLTDRIGQSSGTPTSTREEILRRAKRAAATVGPAGKLWMVFIGHGAPSQGEVLLLGADTGRSADAFVARGLKRSELLEALRSPAQATIAVLDTCFSGQGVAGEKLLDKPLQPALLSNLAESESAIELLATSKDQFAGPLPGETRPAFSYLVLGALRGWGEESLGANRDGVVTASEALSYTRETLGMLVVGRTQEPTINAPDPSFLEMPLAAGAESGPDRRILREAIYGGEGGEDGLGGASLEVRNKLWDQACEQKAQELATEAHEAKLAAVAAEKRAEAQNSWASLQPELEACSALGASEREGCVRAAEKWVASANDVVAVLPAGVETVRPTLTEETFGRPDCGPREAVFKAQRLPVEIPEVELARGYIDSLRRGGSSKRSRKGGGQGWSARSRRAVGGVFTGLGVATIVGTALLSDAFPRGSDARPALVAANTAGWAFAYAGGGVLVSGLLSGNKRAPGATVSVTYRW